MRCKHLRPNSGGCDAFPFEDGGIPWEITSGSDKHLGPLPGQKNDIVFEGGEPDQEEGLDDDN